MKDIVSCPYEFIDACLLAGTLLAALDQDLGLPHRWGRGAAAEQLILHGDGLGIRLDIVEAQQLCI